MSDIQVAAAADDGGSKKKSSGSGRKVLCIHVGFTPGDEMHAAGFRLLFRKSGYKEVSVFTRDILKKYVETELPQFFAKPE